MRRVRIVFHDPRGAYRLLAELVRISSPVRWLARVRREGPKTVIEVPAVDWNDDVAELAVGFGGQQDGARARGREDEE